MVRCSRSCGPINPAPSAITTTKDADAIYVLVEGQVVQFGTYDSLLSQQGPFSELAKRQLVYLFHCPRRTDSFAMVSLMEEAAGRLARLLG